MTTFTKVDYDPFGGQPGATTSSSGPEETRYARRPTLTKVDYDPFASTGPVAAKPQAEPGFVGAAVRGFKRSLPETKSLLYGALAAGAKAVGADGVSDWALKGYQDVTENEVNPLANQHGIIDTVQGKGSISTYLGDTIGNFAGQGLQSAALGVAGGIAGGAVGGVGGAGVGAAPGAILGAIGGLAAKTAGKKLIATEMKELIAEQVAKGVAKDVAEAAVKKAAAKEAAGIGAGTLAATGLNVGQEIGTAYTGRAMDAQQAGEQLTQGDALRAIGWGIPAGVLDTAAEGMTAVRALHGASGSPRFAKRVVAGAAQGALTEGATEVAQSAMERAGAGQALTGKDAVHDYIESGVAGMIGGSAGGGLGGVRRNMEKAGEDPAAGAGERVAARPVPDVAFPDAAPGSLSDAANAVVERNAARPTPVHPDNELATMPYGEAQADGEQVNKKPAATDAQLGQATHDILSNWPADVPLTRGAVRSALESKFGRSPTEQVQSVLDAVQQQRAQNLTSWPDSVAPASVPATSDALEARRALLPENVTWINSEAGEVRNPTGEELRGVMHDYISRSSESGLGVARKPLFQRLQELDGGLKRGVLEKAFTEAQAERKRGLVAPEMAAGGESPAAPAMAAAGTPASQARQSIVAQSTGQERLATSPKENADVPGAKTTQPLGDGGTDRKLTVDVHPVQGETRMAAVPEVKPAQSQVAPPATASATEDDASPVTVVPEIIQRQVGRNKMPFKTAADAERAIARGQHDPSDYSIDAVDGGFVATRRDVPQAETPVTVAAASAATSPTNDIPEPTPAQLEAGNFKVGRMRINGLDLSIEHPAGVKRKPEHSAALAHAYGYIRRTEGADGEKVDAYLGPHASDTSRPVFVVDQHKEDGTFDEHKALMGFETEQEARDAYQANYPKDWKGLGGIRQMSHDEFKAWVQDPEQTVKPATEAAAAPARAPISIAQTQADHPVEVTSAVRLESSAPASTKSEAVSKPPEKIEDIGEKIGGARKDTAEKTGARKGAKAKDDRPTWRKRFEVVENVAENAKPEQRWQVFDTKTGRELRGVHAESLEKAEALVPLAAVSQKHSVRMNRDKTYSIWRNVTDRKRVQVVKETFPTQMDALKYMRDNAEKILETKTSFGEEVLEKPDTVRRTGPARRDGDVKANDFTNAFGFRGVEFGNWNNQRERQEVMNHAFDALHDLAEVLDIPPKAISLNGELALAFGARGQGLSGARAHYEISKGVINLTKMTGAGATAHEWFHALDHYFGRQEGVGGQLQRGADGLLEFPDSNTNAMLSNREKYRDSGMRPELKKAYLDLIRGLFIKAEQYVEDTQRAEKFVSSSHEELAKQLQDIRDNLATEQKWGQRNKKPATAEQLTQFDALAAKLMDGPQVFAFKPNEKKTGGMGRNTNDALEAMSAILKKVRGTSGFNANQSGLLDRVRGNARRHAERMAMLESAQKADTKERSVPTEYSMHSRLIDEGRVSDYWTTPHEMAARAFSVYVEDKVEEAGNVSDFLSFGSDNERPSYRLLGMRPFPEGAERKEMNERFDALFEAMQTMEGDDGKVALYSKTKGEKSTGGLDYARAQDLKHKLTRNWGENAPSVRLVESAGELQRAAGLPKSALSDPDFHRAEGLYQGAPTVFLNLAAIRSEERFAQVLAHEALGHYGVEQVVGKGEWKSITDTIAAHERDGTGIDEVRRAIAHVKRTQPDIDTKSDPQSFAKEVIAVMAEQGASNGLLRRVIAAVRKWLRQHMPAMKWTDRDVVNLLADADGFLRAGTPAYQRRAEMRQRLAFSQAPAPSSAQFKSWFGDSKVTQQDGSPRVVYHGTASEFWAFDKSKLTSNTGHMTAPFGFYFAEQKEKAQHYAEKNSDGVPADERVVDVYLSIQNPATMTLAEFQEVDDFDQAKALRAKFERQGHDGIHVPEIRQWIAFEPEQVKSASQNRGGYDPKNPDMRFSKAGAEFTPAEGEGERYRTDLDATMRSLRTLVNPVKVMDVPPVLAHLDVPVLPITITRDVVRKATNNVKHNVPMDAIRNLPELISDPQAVFDSRSTDGGLVMLLDAKDDSGRPVLVAIHMSQRENRMAVNRIASVYGKDNAPAALKSWTDQGLLLYIADTKNPDLVRLMGLQLPASGSPDQGFWSRSSGVNVLTKDEIVKDTASSDRPLFSKAPKNSQQEEDARRLAEVEKAVAPFKSSTRLERAKEWLKDVTPAKLKDAARQHWLGFLTLSHLVELAGDRIPGIGMYGKLVQEMAGMRAKLEGEADVLSRQWQTWASKNPKEYEEQRAIMHEATILGVDPAEDYQPLTFRYGGQEREVNRANLKEALKALKEQARGLAGESKNNIYDEMKKLRAMEKAEPRRKSSYPELRARWEAMSPKAKELYITARDTYRARSDMTEQLLVDRINSTEATDSQKRKLINMIRQTFEENRVSGVYFPLQRFGQYFVAAKKGDTTTFMRYESLREAQAGEKSLKADGWDITASGLRSEQKAASAPPESFVADVIKIMQKSHIAESVQDEVYQTFLETLPELSMRKHQIHRKSIPGFDPDAIRAFAHNLRHGSTQLARMKYSPMLGDQLNNMQKHVDEMRKDPNRTVGDNAAADAILGELNQRHEWLMNPQDSQLAGSITGLGFIYYLGLSPASALTNLTQTPIITFPYLAARYGAGSTAKALMTASRFTARSAAAISKDSMNDWTGKDPGFKHRDRVELADPDEARAMQALEEAGVLDRTQSMSLADIAAHGSDNYSPAKAKALSIIGFGFHITEVMNRETTALATYRLARAAGEGHAQAVQSAIDAINQTHYDYSNANRARFMQSGAAKTLLLFRQYSLNTTWHWGRMVWNATKDQDPETRKIARRNLAGLVGMTGMFSGALGLPIAGMLTTALNSIAASFGDDDEPWDAETEFGKFLQDMFGKDVAEVIQHGAVNKLTGVDIASRTGMADMWYREPNKDLSGKQFYYYLLEQAAGPAYGMVGNFMEGKKLMDEGHINRGIEKMVPNALKYVMRSYRYATEGVNNIDGQPIIEDLSTAERAVAALGFTPTRLAEQYDENSQVKKYEQHVLRRKQALMNAYALASRINDDEGRSDVLDQVRAFNQKWPQLAITPRSLNLSLKAHQRAAAETMNGIRVSKKIGNAIREQVGANGGGGDDESDDG